jgi:serine/threonine protein kinase
LSLLIALQALVAGIAVTLCPQVQCKTAYVAHRSTPDGPHQETLLEALGDSNVTTIVLLTDISTESLAAHPDHIQLDRNLTITSKDPRHLQVWDIQLQWGSIHLCSTCILTFESLALAYDTEETGPNVVFVAGSPSNSSWGLVRMSNVIRFKHTCSPSGAAAAFFKKNGNPHLPRIQQVASVQDYEFRGTLYNDTLRIASGAARVDPLWVPDRDELAGGYDMLYSNYTRLCGAYIDPSCLQQNAEKVCITLSLASNVGQQQQQQRRVHPVAIALPVALGVLVLLAAFGLWWRRRRRLQRANGAFGGGKGHTPFVVGFTPMTSPDGSNHQDTMDEELGPKRPVPSHPGFAPSHAISSSSTGTWQLLHAYTCSTVSGVAAGVSCPTSALDGAEQLAAIQLGPLLGAGSFGRVYRGTWRGREVAVKVIDHHDGGELADVFREAELLLSLNHDNIVKAYSFITCTWIDPASQPSGETSSRKASPGCCTPPDARQPTPGDIHQQQGPAAVDAVNNGDDSISNAQCGALKPWTCGDSSLGGPQPTTAGLMSDQDAAAAGAPAVSCAAAAADALGPGSSSRTTSSPSTNIISGSCNPAGQPRLMKAAETRLSSSSSRGSGDNTRRAVRTWIIMEYCDSGDLSSVVRVLRSGLETSLDSFMVYLLSLLLDAARGLAHLHERHIVHGDLNARNVLVNVQLTLSGQRVVTKVSDFGMSRSLIESHKTTGARGTITHMSPERLTSGRLSPAADVFAFGVMMWEVWTGKSAFKRMHYGQVCQAVVMQDARPPVPADMPQDYRELMVRCWAREPFQRPSMTQVQQSLEELLQAALACAGMDSSSGALAAASAVASLSNGNLMLQQQQQQKKSSGGALRNAVHQKLEEDERPSSEQQQQTVEAVSRGILTTPQLVETSTLPGPSRPCPPAAVDPGPGVMPAAVDSGPGVIPAAADGRPDEALGGPLQ